MGRSATQRMQDSGIQAKKGSILLVPIDDIWIAGEGHPLHHPRGLDPIDEELTQDIVNAQEIRKPIVVRDEGTTTGGTRMLSLLDGARRTVNGREAQKRLRASGVLGKEEPLYVKVELFTGNDTDFLLARLGYNSDPLKKPDAPSVLAATIVQLSKLNAPIERVLGVMPRHVDRGIAEAMQSWGNLLPEVAARFDAGAPLGLLRAVLDGPRAGQGETLDMLEAAGITSQKGATRTVNAAKKRAAVAPATDGGTPGQQIPRDGDTLPTRKASDTKIPSSDLGKVPVQRPVPKAMAKMLEGATGCGLGNGETTADFDAGEAYDLGLADGFAAGLKVALGLLGPQALPEGPYKKHVLSALKGEK